jgi:PAB1-binding protein PBP1
MSSGNTSSFRTDTAISGGRTQGERELVPWVPDAADQADGSLESGRMRGAGGDKWDQFAENERKFGLKTDYREDIYTTAINKNHPQYKQRLADADRKAREIERSTATNSHVAEERIKDNLTTGDNGDEEDK